MIQTDEDVLYSNKQGTCTASSNSKSAVSPIYSLGDTPNTPIKERIDIMNRNPKEKLARIEIRVKTKDKEKIKRISEKCNLSVSEYVVQRALGYAPKTVQPDVFFDFYNKLCELCNVMEFTPEIENKLLALIDEIHSELLLPEKETEKQIKNGIESELSGSPKSQGLFGEKEHPRSDEPFGTSDESDKRSVM